MTIDLDRLKELFQGYVASKEPKSRRGCPDPSAIAGSFEPEASPRRKKRIIEHISRCPLCREEFMMLVERQAGEPGAAELLGLSTRQDRCASADNGVRRPPMAVWRLAVALLGLGLIVTSFVVVTHQRDRWEVLRSGEATIRLVAPKPDQSVSQPPVCRWEARTAAEYYVLELFDEALLPVWTSGRVIGSELHIPVDVYARLLPGRRYFWMVTGYSGQTATGESLMGRFLVSR